MWSAVAHTDAHVSLVAQCGFAVAVLCVFTFFSLCVSHHFYFLSPYFLSQFILLYFIPFDFSHVLSHISSHLLAHHISFHLVSSLLVSDFIWSNFSLSFFTFHIICLFFSSFLSSGLFHSSLFSHLLCLVVSVSCSLLIPHLVSFTSCFSALLIYFLFFHLVLCVSCLF